MRKVALLPGIAPIATARLGWGLLRQLFQNRLLRNVAVVASGTAGAQMIALILSPFVTRLYGPEAFGIAGIVMSLVAVLTPLITLSYPLAIVLAEDDREARLIVLAAVLLSIAATLLLALAIMSLPTRVEIYLKLNLIPKVAFVVSGAVLAAALAQVIKQYLYRNNEYREASIILILQSLISNGSKVAIGLFYPLAIVLVFITAFGDLVYILIYLAIRGTFLRSIKMKATVTSLICVLKKYKDFAIFRTPQISINAFSQSLPIIMLAVYFGAAAAGFYVLARTVLAAPTSLVANALGDVFYPRLAAASRNGENVYKLILHSTIGLSVVGAIPFLSIGIFGNSIYSLIFGQEWGRAGEYSSWLALWLFFGFINRPCVVAAAVLNAQRGLLNYEIFSTASKILGFIVGVVIYSNDLVAVALFSLAGSVAYIGLILWILKLSHAATMNGKEAFHD